MRLLNVKVESLASAFQIMAEAGCGSDATPALYLLDQRLLEVERYLRELSDSGRRLANLELQLAVLASARGPGADGPTGAPFAAPVSSSPVGPGAGGLCPGPLGPGEGVTFPGGPASPSAHFDPWSRYAGKGGGGHGPSGDGGPSGPPGGPPGGHDGAPHNYGDGHGARGNYGDGHGAMNMEKIFDDKVALSSEYSHAGGSHGDLWRVRVQNYWISKLPELMPVLDWVEQREAERDDLLELPELFVQAAQQGWRARWRRGFDLSRANELIWGFLNMALKGEAHRGFELAPRLNGLEGWRLAVRSIQRGRVNRLAELRKVVRNPPGITKLEEVENGIIRFENTLREYEACGGTKMSETDKKTDLLDMLPGDIRENLIWRSTGPQ